MTTSATKCQATSWPASRRPPISQPSHLKLHSILALSYKLLKCIHGSLEVYPPACGRLFHGDGVYSEMCHRQLHWHVNGSTNRFMRVYFSSCARLASFLTLMGDGAGSPHSQAARAR